MIYLLLMNNIIVSIRLVLSEYLGSVNLRHELYMYVRSVTYWWCFYWITLIDMSWCWCLWWYWYEMMLLLMIMSIWVDDVIDDYVNMRWCSTQYNRMWILIFVLYIQICISSILKYSSPYLFTYMTMKIFYEIHIVSLRYVFSIGSYEAIIYFQYIFLITRLFLVTHPSKLYCFCF